MKIKSIILPLFAVFCIFAFAVMQAQPAFAQTESATPPKKTRTERLLKTELDEFASDKDGLTHLHWAAMANDVEAIKRLAAVGAFMDPVEKSDESSYTEKTIRRAALLGIDLKNQKRHSKTPFTIAFIYQKFDALSALSLAGANPNAVDNYGKTALMSAAQKGHAEVVKMLLSAGADVNAADNYDWTALMVAAELGHAKVAEILLSAGANLNAKNRHGDTALYWAKENGHSEIVSMLKQAGAWDSDEDGLTDLHWAAMENDVETINRFASVVEFVDPIEKSDTNSYTVKTIRRAALLGIDLKKWTRRARTPLMMASIFNKLNAVRALLAVGANLDAKQNYGWTALMYAAEFGNTELAKILLSAGADVNAKNKDGSTALMIMAEFGHAEVAEILLSAGANPNAKNKHGETALFWAKEKGHSEVVRMLKRAGARE